MDYLSLLTRQPTEGSAETAAVARRLFQTGLYTNNEVVKKEQRTIAETININDLLTAENIIADPDTGVRITPFLTLKSILGACTINHPHVDNKGKLLKGIQNAMAIPTKHILKELSYASKLNNGVALISVQSQIKFGFDPITEVLKNCCASHVVMHSFLRSCLLTLYEKVKEWGPYQLEQGGQEMALCNIINIMGRINAIMKEARQATEKPYTSLKTSTNRDDYNTTGKNKSPSSSSCSRCGRKCCKSDIVSRFVKGVSDIQDQVCASAIDKLRAFMPSTTNPPPEFLIKDIKDTPSGNKRIKLDDPLLCPYTPATSSNVQTAITHLAKNKIMFKERKIRIIKGAELVLNQIRKEDEEEIAAVTTSTEPPPIEEEALSTSVTATTEIGDGLASILGENPTKHLHPKISPMSPPPSFPEEDESEPLAPTEQQVQELAPEVALEEAYGLTHGTGQVRRRDQSNMKSMAEYAKRGSGTNTGKYGTFNASLST